MNYNELKEKAHSNAVKHGFWENRLSDEHCLMLIITEVGELVEADRKNKHPIELDIHKKSCERYANNAEWNHIGFANSFSTCLKDTIEDEFADVAIRLLDLAGALGVDFDKMKPCRYFHAFDKFSFTENAFGLVKGLSRDVIGIEKRIQFGLEYITKWVHSLGIDLAWHIEQKMKYNESRPPLHGKKY